MRHPDDETDEPVDLPIESSPRPVHRDRKKEHKPAPPMPVAVVLDAARMVIASLRCDLLEHSLHIGGRARFVVDRDPDNVDADLLVELVRGLHKELVARGLDPQDYDLEIESPGNHRLLSTPRHLERFRGQRVRAVLTTPIEGRGSVVGKLIGVEDGKPVVLSDDGRRITLDPGEVREIRLHG
jgi:ribosome maturation factor RimP